MVLRSTLNHNEWYLELWFDVGSIINLLARRAETSDPIHPSNPLVISVLESRCRWSRLSDIAHALHVEYYDAYVECKANRSSVMASRSQLMLAEFKKDSALKEFTELSSELERGRQLQASIQLESAQRIPVTDKPNPSSSYGLTSAEVGGVG